MGWRSGGGARGLFRGAAAAFSRTYYTIQAVPREHTGSRLAARERALGRIPAVVLTQGGGEGPEASRKLLLTADKKQIVTLLKRVPFFCSTTFALQVRGGPGSSALLQSGTVLPIKVVGSSSSSPAPSCPPPSLTLIVVHSPLVVQIHKDAETGQVLNLVLAWAEKEAVLKVDVPVVYKGEDVCPGLKKGARFSLPLSLLSLPFCLEICSGVS